MSNDLVITQARLGTRTSFTFGADRVTHVISDRSGERSFSAPYQAIDLDNSETLSITSGKPTVYLWAAGFPIGFFALRVGYDHQTFGAVLGAIGFALIFGGILAKDFKWFRIPIDLVPVAGTAHVMRVLRDGQHERILQEFTERRRLAMRALYAKIDANADPAQEMARFDWLLENGIVTAEEHAAAATTLRPAAVRVGSAVH